MKIVFSEKSFLTNSLDLNAPSMYNKDSGIEEKERWVLVLKNRRFKPKIDKTVPMIWIPLGVILIIATALAVFDAVGLCIMLVTDIFTFYFLISPLFGYAELRENTLYVKFGFILKREIPYSKIRGFEKSRKFYSESMLSLKLAMEHINIKYNKFDVISVSVVTNDAFLEELKIRTQIE